MSNGQWTVLMLIVLLLGMEMLANPAVGGFVKTWVATPFRKAAS